MSSPSPYLLNENGWSVGLSVGLVSPARDPDLESQLADTCDSHTFAPVDAIERCIALRRASDARGSTRCGLAAALGSVSLSVASQSVPKAAEHHLTCSKSPGKAIPRLWAVSYNLQNPQSASHCRTRDAPTKGVQWRAFCVPPATKCVGIIGKVDFEDCLPSWPGETFDFDQISLASHHLQK